MPSLDRTVAGLTCRDVLADLSEYLDGELPAGRVARLEAHLAACDACTRFGGAVGALVARVRAELGTAARLDAGVAERLARRLRREAS